MSGPPIHRRGFLALSLAGIGLLAAAWLVPSCEARHGEIGADELAAKIRELLGIGSGAATTLAAAGMDRETARDLLVGGRSAQEMQAILASRDTLRDHVAERTRSDLAAGRVRYASGWLLAESEVALAALLAP